MSAENPAIVSCTEAEFLAVLSEIGPWSRKFIVRHGEAELIIVVKRTTSRDVEFRFPGCLGPNRSVHLRNSPPGPPTRFGPNQVTVFDPGVEASPKLRTTWYTGWHRYPAQTLLVELQHRIVDAIGGRRVLMIGASAGGFAALYYSWHFAGSVALVANPQTSLERYTHKGSYSLILNKCWPGSRNRRLSSLVTTDLCPLYAKGMSNSVIIIQNASDLRHVGPHFGRFLGAVREEDMNRVVAICDWWGGRMGHATPTGPIMGRWREAALSTPNLRAYDLLRAFHSNESKDDRRHETVDHDLATRLVIAAQRPSEDAP